MPKTLHVDLNKADYYQLLNLAFSSCSMFILVERDQLEFNPNARSVAKALEPFLIKMKVQEEWPGTRLMGHYANVYYYKTAEKAKDVLKSCSEGFCDWTAPHLLEDLCFLKADGSAWLASITHEHEVWINEPTQDELERLSQIEGFRRHMLKERGER